MILYVGEASIPLEDKEYLEYHNGRSGHPFNLDTSICGIKDFQRAELLKTVFTALYPFPSYKMEGLVILPTESSFELLFSMSDFCLLVKENV